MKKHLRGREGSKAAITPPLGAPCRSGYAVNWETGSFTAGSLHRPRPSQCPCQTNLQTPVRNRATVQAQRGPRLYSLADPAQKGQLPEGTRRKLGQQEGGMSPGPAPLTHGVTIVGLCPTPSKTKSKQPLPRKTQSTGIYRACGLLARQNRRATGARRGTMGKDRAPCGV